MTASVQELEALTCMNWMIFINLGHSSGYDEFEIFYGIMGALTDLPLDYAPYIVVQCIQPCFWRT